MNDKVCFTFEGKLQETLMNDYDFFDTFEASKFTSKTEHSIWYSMESQLKKFAEETFLFNWKESDDSGFGSENLSFIATHKRLDDTPPGTGIDSLSSHLS